MTVILKDDVTGDFIENVEINLIIKSDLEDPKNADFRARLNFLYGEGRWFCTVDEFNRKIRYYKVSTP